MLLGTLTPEMVRSTYLRGIDIGTAWYGPSADAAIMQLLLTQVAHAEALMGIHWQRWRVAMMPDDTQIPGQDYDLLAQVVPYVALTPEETLYRVKLAHHDVHAITRVRLATGFGTALPAYYSVALPDVRFSVLEERLLVPGTAVPVPEPQSFWAVDYLMGMAMLPAEVEEWCALGAAIEVLSLSAVGTDVSHGLEAESLTQDGVVESVKYGGSTQAGGMYAGPVAILRDRRADIDLVALRFRYQNTLGDLVQIPVGAVVPTRVPFSPS